MTTTHTPGPWEVHRSVPDLMPIRVVRAGGKAVATVPGFDHTPSELEANAKLIAAAPKLLKALKECFEWLEAQPGMEMLLETGNPEVTTLFNDCQSIIAEAEGR